jgi:hypothetical protein
MVRLRNSDDSRYMRAVIVTASVKNMPLKKAEGEVAGSKCSCGSWLILAGFSYVRPSGYSLRRKCVRCGTCVVNEKTTTSANGGTIS